MQGGHRKQIRVSDSTPPSSDFRPWRVPHNSLAIHSPRSWRKLFHFPPQGEERWISETRNHRWVAPFRTCQKPHTPMIWLFSTSTLSTTTTAWFWASLWGGLIACLRLSLVIHNSSNLASSPVKGYYYLPFNCLFMYFCYLRKKTVRKLKFVFGYALCRVWQVMILWGLNRLRLQCIWCCTSEGYLVVVGF